MSDSLPENFCSHCGVSLVPLHGMHTSAACATCGKTKYFVRPGDGGKGIRVEAGDLIHIPAGTLQLSFDPARSSGRLARGGVPFLLKTLFTSGMPQKPEEFVNKLRALRDVWEQELQSSDKLAGIDLSAPSGGDEAFERLKDEKDSWEWHMLLRDLFAVLTLEAVEKGDATTAAHFGLYTGLLRGLSIVTEPYFEETLWRGYLAGLAIHQCSTSADHVPGEVEALAELDPLFRRIGEATLRTWIDSGSAIGPRIGVTTIPETILLARAKWHLERLKSEREEKSKQPAEHRAKSELRIKWLTFWLSLVGSGVVGSLVGKFWPAISG